VDDDEPVTGELVESAALPVCQSTMRGLVWLVATTTTEVDGGAAG
jgi:hypothetical protein